jgi:hypothetical protein
MSIDPQWARSMADERGSVESALVLLPLMILVLSILQIAMGVLHRDLGDASAQSSVIKSTLYSPLGRSPLTLMSSQGLTQLSAVPLSGGGNIYIGKRVERSPSLTPLLPEGDNFFSTGIAIGEHS